MSLTPNQRGWFGLADQGRWFKLWASAVSDPDLRALSLEDFGRWCAFGVYLKIHGRDGHLDIRTPGLPLQELLRLPTFEMVVNVLRSFPHCRVTPVTNTPVTIHVEWENWKRYQGDYSGDRVRHWRGTHAHRRNADVTPKEEKRSRRDEKRSKPPMVPQSVTWPSPEALVALYNVQAPDECPAVSIISDQRRKKARAYLDMFPKEEFWAEVCGQIKVSRFLRGLTPPTGGRKPFIADFDWLLTKNQDGTENCVKVYEGRYRD